MTNPTWQPGPPKEAGWFWITDGKTVEFVNVVGFGTELFSGDRIFGHYDSACFSLADTIRHAGPVAIPEPVEPDSNRQPEPAGPCDVDGGFYTGVK